MDKNTINIDELVKLRLSGGEEHERSGSWANMRELLDQKMPTNKPAAVYNWRRMLGVMTGLALLGALSLGGYQVMSTRFANGNAESGHSANSTGTPNPNSGGSGFIAASDPTNSNTESTEHTSINTLDNKTNNSKLKGTSISAKSNKLAKATSNQGVTGSTKSTDIKTDIVTGNTGTASTKNVDVIKAQPSQARQTNKTTTGTVANNVAPANQAVPSGATEKPKASEAQKTDLIASATKTEPALKTTNTNNLNSTNPSVSEPAKVTASNKSVAADPNLDELATVSAAVADNTNTAKIKTPAPLEPALPKDSFRKMTVLQRSVINPVAKTRTLITDTISIERVAMERQHLNSADDQQSGKSSAGKGEETSTQLNPSSSISLAAAKADAGVKEEFVSLSSFKVKSRRTNKWDAQGFRDKMRDVKFNLSQIKFYPGVSAGYSYMSGMSGPQFGLFGLVTFGEHWNAMTEIKYVHRFNNGSVVQDDYSDIEPSATGFLQSKVENFFKFTTLQSLEMPIALRYAAGRLNLFGGINMSYHFAVDAENVTLPSSDSTFTPTTTPAWGNTKPTVSYGDFRSRFSLGGLLGAGYELSPSIQLDLRVSKNFWDNAKGIGAEKVSQQLYRPPSFQVSIFYRFSQKNQIPKAK